MHAGLRVEHAKHDVGLGDRELDLLADLRPPIGIVGLAFEPAGVDEHVRSAERPHVGVVPVARDARLVVHDGEGLAGPGD